MVPKKKFCLIGLIFLLALLCFHSQVYAEQLNNSVKDCLEKPDTCGEQEDSLQSEKKDGAESNNSNSSAAVGDTSTVGLTIWDFGKMIMATIFVIALLYFVLKFVNKKSTMFKSSRLIENLGGVPLGSNRSVQMIKIGNRLFVVGVGENIQLLKEIEDEKEYEQILSDYNSKLDQLVQPNELLTKLIKKAKGHTKNSRGESTPPFQSILQQQLDDLAKERKRVYEEVEKSEGTDKQ